MANDYKKDINQYTLLIDAKGGIKHIGEEVSRMLGYSNAVARDKSIFEIDPGMSLLDLRKFFKQDIKNTHHTRNWYNAKGEDITIKFESTVIEQEESSILYWNLLLAPSALPKEQQKSRLEQLVANAQFVIWNWNLAEQKMIATSPFYHFFSIPTSTSNVLPALKEAIPQKQWKILENALKQAVEDRKGIFQNIEFSEEQQFCFYIEPNTEKEKITEVSGTIHRLPLKFESSNTFSNLEETTIDVLPVPILWMRTDGLFSYANEAAATALRYAKEQITSEIDIWKIDIEISKSEWEKSIELVKSGKTVTLESNLQRSDHTVLFAELQLIPLAVAETELICILINDIAQRLLEETRLQNSMIETNVLRHQLEMSEELLQKTEHTKIITQNEGYLEVIQQVIQVAPTDATVLILGETGTGKELLAALLHEKSKRSQQSFVKVNCAALSEQIIESELFGHEKGAFTGAFKRKLGRFEIADQGTLFLDEIGELPLSVQTKLLRILQNGEFERLGGTETISVDVRLVCATNRNLEEMMEQKEFRSDLYYRINIFPIENMPLRNRADDIPLLVEFFLGRFGKKMGKKITKVRKFDMKRLENYHFPGNVRELENIIERSVVLSTSQTLNLTHWEGEKSTLRKGKKETFKTLQELERDHIVEALKKCRWRVSGSTGAAALLDINPKTLHSRMRKLGIKRTLDP